MLTGKYPAILKDETVGIHATELFNDANRMLDDIITHKKLTAKAVFGLFPAYSFGEDVSIFEDEPKNKHITTFHFLRQQVQKRSNQPNVCLSDFIAEKYKGKRPALGYPACPDHTEKKTLFRVLDVKNNIGISLTESCAMYPASSVSGFYFSNPNCRYFNVGKLNKDQIEEYSKRKNQSIEETEKWLAPNLAYINYSIIN